LVSLGGTVSLNGIRQALTQLSKRVKYVFEPANFESGKQTGENLRKNEVKLLQPALRGSAFPHNGKPSAAGLGNPSQLSLHPV
jgi:hypothetical protein